MEERNLYYESSWMVDRSCGFAVGFVWLRIRLCQQPFVQTV